MKKLRNIILAFVVSLLLTAVGFVAYQYYHLTQPGIVTLLYHRVTEQKSESKYSLNVNEFERQLKYLRDNGYVTVLPAEILKKKYQKNPSKTIMISFDDGTEDHYSIVYPLLKRYGFKGIFFVITKYIDHSGSLSSQQIAEMSHGGMEIGSHSYSHPLLDDLRYNEVYKELELSKDQLRKVCGKGIVSFAPPGGWYNSDTLKAAHEVGYKFFFGCEIGKNDLRKRPFVFKRVEVTGNVDMAEFVRLLNPPEILKYKVIQSFKFFVHNILGSKRYQALSSLSSSKYLTFFESP